MIRRTLVVMIVVGLFLAIALVGMTSKSSAEPVPKDDAAAVPQMKEVEDAIARFKERDIEGALTLLKEAANKNPELPPGQVIMAGLCLRANVPQLVRGYLEQAVIDLPDDPDAYLLMADIALSERRVTEAEMLLDKAVALVAKFDKNPKRLEGMRPHVLNGLASVAEARADWPGAQKQLEAFLKLDPKNSDAMQRLARSLFQQKNATGALEKLKEAAKANPSLLTPEAILANFYEQSGDHENAKKWMAAALAAAPKDFETRWNAGQWALQTGQIEEAKSQATAAIQIDPKPLKAKILRGTVALFQKDYSTAERLFEAAHLQSPKDFDASNNLALVLIEQKDEGKRKRALDFSENNINQYGKTKDGAEAASTHGWVLYKMGKIDEAEKYLQAAATSGAFNADTAYYISRLYADKGRTEMAKQNLERALKTTGPFLMRDKAQELLEQLKK
jgi:tetratricopeptide (TPR) repeat protein